MLELLRKLLPGVWLGLLLAIAALLMPAAFAVLGRPTAGVLARAVFALEAPLSIGLGLALLLLERRRAQAGAAAGQGSVFSAPMLLALGTIFCTVVGFYALQPLLEQARLGQATGWSFGQLHAVSTLFFGLKTLLVGALAVGALRAR